MPCLIRERKSGVYYIVLTEHGKRIWKSTRTRNKKEAYQIFLNDAPTHSKEDQAESLTKCTETYLQFVQTQFARKTFEIYSLALRHFLRSVGNVAVDEITSLNVDAYKGGRASKVSPATVNLELRAIKAFFNNLKRWKLLTENPCDGVRYLKIPEQPPLYFRPHELDALVKSIKDSWLREIVVFSAMTGMRLGEVLNVTWNDINIAARMILVRSSHNYQVKAGKMRTIPMNETVLDLLDTRTTREGLVFRGKRGGKANANFVSEKFREAVRETKLDRRLHFHSLRHTFASLLVSKGASLYQVQKLLGHSSPQITEIYAHLENSEMHDVVNLLGLVNGK